MPHFVVIGQLAIASADFLLQDLPSSSGRLDVLLRCVRAALLVSHGVRRDTRIDLCLNGGPRAPRIVRIDGSAARFLRPDERSLAVLLGKVLAAPVAGSDFVEVRPGVCVAEGGLLRLLDELRGVPAYVLQEGARDLRGVEVLAAEGLFFLGDHLGFTPEAERALAAFGAVPVSVGPLSLHAEDVISVVNNELDRRGATTLSS